MDPRAQFCHNQDCRERGLVGQGNIRVHSRQERRYQCQTCRKTFAATAGTPYYRLHKPAELMTVVLTLVSHGCPTQAIVVTFELDERTVAEWVAKGGQHAQRVHEQLVLQGQVDPRHVQADELWVKRVAGRLWLAMAIALPSRLWLGGVLSPQRDGTLITTLVKLVAASARSFGMLVCVDGLSSYVTAVQRVFRHPVRTGKVGRPRLVLDQGVLLGQVVKRYVQRHVASVEQRVVLGTAAAIEAVLRVTGTGTMINTAYIERLNATFRANLAPLVRRGRAIVRTEALLTAGMWLVGCAYNFCWPHDSLRLLAPVEDRKWEDRTPAMAAGLTDHCWTMDELLHYQVPLPAWVAPKRRGRPPKRLQPVTLAPAA
jgi:transposase-like protein